MTTPDSKSATPTPEGTRLAALGALIAGGASRRFGATKGLATIGGRTLAERVATPLRVVVTHPVVITADPAIAAHVGLPARADEVAGQGPLAGIHTALRWARELGLPGALCVACDLPFLTSSLLHAIARAGLESGASTIPESELGRGLEPLCAWYAVTDLEPIESALSRGERSIHLVVDTLSPRRLGLRELSIHGDPRVLFMNVNTPDAAQAAERLVARRAPPPEGSAGRPTADAAAAEPR